ncbi:MAG: ferredoxin [Gammaproteobacteria bacterium]|jgi:ferredoxin|nr:ferredoxin [Gammaproteobacteria bacterium]|tara:strand:+ start:903 stop:1094 length:192 start_codon:yes stop_codon:yes gene_type:complete
MKIKIDLDRCYMSGECFYNHPELFQRGEDGFPVLRTDEPEGDLKKHGDEAIEVCPAAAITLEK